MNVSEGFCVPVETIAAPSVSYPGFTDNAISIVRSPKLTSYDLMFWKTMAALLSMPAKDEKSKELALRMASNVNTLNIYTPSNWLRTAKQEKVDSIMLARQTDMLKKCEAGGTGFAS